MSEPRPARVTVCIPTYNRSAYLREAIESVRAQTYQDFSIHVSDNASTDDTADVVASFADPRISYVRLPRNVGWLGNFNSSLQDAKGEYAVVLGDDDALLPDFLEATVAVLDAHPRVGMAHTAFDLVDRDGKLLLSAVNWTDGLVADTIEGGDTFISESMKWSCRVCASTVLVRMAALPAVRFDPLDLPAADFGLWLRIALDWEVAFLSRPLVRYRIHSESDSASWGAVAGPGYLRDFEILERTRDVKLRLLETYGSRWGDRRRLKTRADWALDREIVGSIRSATLPERRLRPTLRWVAASIVRHPRLARRPDVWRLVAASVLGPRVVARVRGE
jgi:glycosyltransferase involved in cell wall biosynthesis